MTIIDDNVKLNRSIYFVQLGLTDDAKFFVFKGFFNSISLKPLVEGADVYEIEDYWNEGVRDEDVLNVLSESCGAKYFGIVFALGQDNYLNNKNEARSDNKLSQTKFFDKRYSILCLSQLMLETENLI